MNRNKYSLDSLRQLPTGTIIQVNQLTDSHKIEFVSNSQDVAAVEDYTPVETHNLYDSYFAEVQDGDYTQIWGMSGIVPYLTKSLVKIR